MKEITIRLTDPIAGLISRYAKEMGLTSEELIKYLVGSFAQEEARIRQPRMLLEMPGMAELGGNIPNILSELKKDMMKARARDGALSCENCTMKLSVEDVERGDCGSCHAPIADLKKEES